MYIVTGKQIIGKYDEEKEATEIKNKLQETNKEVEYEVVELKQDNIKNDEWEIINEQINRSKIHRYKWKNLIGMTLTEKASELYANGYSSKKAILKVRNELIMKGHNDKKMFKNLEIGISSRYGEIKSETKTIKKTKEKRK